MALLRQRRQRMEHQSRRHLTVGPAGFMRGRLRRPNVGSGITAEEPFRRRACDAMAGQGGEPQEGNGLFSVRRVPVRATRRYPPALCHPPGAPWHGEAGRPVTRGPRTGKAFRLAGRGKTTASYLRCFLSPFTPYLLCCSGVPRMVTIKPQSFYSPWGCPTAVSSTTSLPVGRCNAPACPASPTSQTYAGPSDSRLHLISHLPYLFGRKVS